MKNKKIMSEFLDSLSKNNKLTLFFKIVFNYKVLNDYNYISRFVNKRDYFIIDIYDNVLDNRFNRYIFDFKNDNYVININSLDDVIVTSICVNGSYFPSNNLMKLSYMFSKHNQDIIAYGKNFLPDEILNILEDIIKK